MFYTIIIYSAFDNLELNEFLRQFDQKNVKFFFNYFWTCMQLALIETQK